MPVNSTHPDYDANILAWQRARDVFAGEDAVKAAAEKYLPRLDCQDDKEYLDHLESVKAGLSSRFDELVFIYQGDRMLRDTPVNGTFH